jgi:hypothetical protein
MKQATQKAPSSLAPLAQSHFANLSTRHHFTHIPLHPLCFTPGLDTSWQIEYFPPAMQSYFYFLFGLANIHIYLGQDSYAKQ